MAFSLSTLDEDISSLREPSSESGVLPTESFMLPNVANVRAAPLRAAGRPRASLPRPRAPQHSLITHARPPVLLRASSTAARQQPAAFTHQHFAPRYDDHAQTLKFAKGTTTLGFMFKGGVLISVDSRSTQGPYIASQSVQKVIEINPYLLGTMAGGAADCSYWERNLGIQCRMYELRNKERISVAAASKMLWNTLYAYKGYGLVCGTMIAGWDKTGPRLYYVDSDGTRLEAKKTMPRFSVGSGSTYAYGVLDSNYRWDMTDEEAIELGQRAIYHATFRDAYSGGTNNVYLVKEEGWTKISSIDVMDLHYKFKAEKDAIDAAAAASR
jgi:20S proteasome subunit beta 5